MGGKESKEINNTVIENEIKTEITNVNKNLTDIINTNITNSTMNVVNTNAQSIANNTGGGNMLNLSGGLSVSGRGSVFDVNQSVSISATTTAVANVIQSTEATNALASSINNDLMNKIKNDSTMSQAMQAATNLNAATSTAGGMADMIASVTGMVNNALSAGDKMSSEKNTSIKTRVMNSLSNTTINENKIKTIIENNITNNISQSNMASCTNNINLSNTINIDGAVSISDGGVAKLNQIASLTALSSCVLGAAQTNTAVNEIMNDVKNTASTDTENKTKVTQSQAATTSITDTKTTGSAFEDMISNIAEQFGPAGIISAIATPLIIGCVCCCLVIVIFMIYMSMGSKSSSAPTAPSVESPSIESSE